MKTLDEKLKSIHADPFGSKAFIVADAKDADMAFGIAAPGSSPEAHSGELRQKNLADYREQIRQVIRQGIVDIVLMSASTNDLLAHQERLFENSSVTPAARANDTSEIWLARGGRYSEHPSQPFRTATLDDIQCGHVDCSLSERSRGTDLGLYSLTFNNHLQNDKRSIETYRSFRVDAERVGFRHFLEVFDPNVDSGILSEELAGFVNDNIVRTLAGMPVAARPVFLKIVYHGPKAMEELVAYDPHLIVGILGGSAGTTYDAFKMLAEAQKYGARAALYGRKINNAECQLAFIQFLRLIADGVLSPEEAVRAYHGTLQKLKIPAHRPLKEDLELHSGIMSYGGSKSTGLVPEGVPVEKSSEKTAQDRLGPITYSTAAQKANDCGCGCGGTDPSKCPNKDEPIENGESQPDFAKMTSAEKLAYNQALRDRIYGTF